LSFEMFYYLFFPFLMILLVWLTRRKVLQFKWQSYVLLLSFVLSLIAIVLNVYIFIPYVAFLALFFIWYSGYYFCLLYLNKGLFVINNLSIPFLILVVLLVINYQFHSANFGKLLTGACIFFSFLLVYFIKSYFNQFFKISEKLFNYFFLAIGKGSYAVYLLHFPLLLLMKYYQLTKGYEILLAMIMLTLVCIYLEQLMARQQWSFLKRDYAKFFMN
jgi:peptidoglycan/LPS O-acetylase OafA/YrhL